MTAPLSVWWRRWLAVVVVALVAAGFAIVFRASLAAALRLLGGDGIVAMIEAAPAWQRIALPVIGGLGVGLVMLVAARVREGAGVSFVMEAIVLGRVRVPLLRSALLAVASWLAIASGASLGREASLIQFGAAAGEGARRAFALDNVTARIVVAAGVAAGFASAYNAPVAAVLFVVEIDLAHFVCAPPGMHRRARWFAGVGHELPARDPASISKQLGGATCACSRNQAMRLASPDGPRRELSATGRSGSRRRHPRGVIASTIVT